MRSELNSKELSDAAIGNYILNKQNKDSKFDSYAELSSDLPLGLFEWYPFEENSSILHVGAGFGAIAERLSDLCKNITITEKNEYRMQCAKERLKNKKNVSVINGDYKKLNEKYDYILYVADKDSGLARNLLELEKVIKELKDFLTENGRLLIVMHNSLGVKYLCGTPNPFTDIPFDAIDENDENSLYITREEIESFFCNMGFKNVKRYYPFPDYQTVGLICSDNYKPTQVQLHERIRVSLPKNNTLLDDSLMLDKLSQNADILSFTNAFFIECTNAQPSNIVYATLSIDREKDKACVTRVLDNKTVEKSPIYKESKDALVALFNNTKELKDLGFPVLDMQMQGNKLIMQQVEAILLDEYITKLIKENNRTEFLNCIEELYKYILTSSEHLTSDKNSLLHYAPDEDWGVILKKAYLDMVSVNCFIEEGKLLFFDQEFVVDNYPAKYVLYKCIYRIYTYLEGAEELIPLEEIKNRYNLKNIWEYFELEENKFGQKLIQKKPYGSYYYSNESDKEIKKINRENLFIGKTAVNSVFNVIAALDNRQIILFGSGKFADYYFKEYGEEYTPLFIVDNNSEKWGTKKNGIEIKNPLEICNLMKGSYRVIIAIADFVPIIRQLETLGLDRSDYRIYYKQMNEISKLFIENPMTNEKYNTGFTMGVFDLFHIGHLNLLKNSKERCHKLIVGVMDDESVEQCKHKKTYIPFEERMEIVKQCKYVDEVVEVSLKHPNGINMWKELRYDCIFMGDDHKGNDEWLYLQLQLESVGANVEYFKYTDGTSSTKIQSIISKEIGG